MSHASEPAPRSESAPRAEPAAGLVAPVDRVVAEDLEAIFPNEAAGPARPARLRLRRRARPAGGKRSRERRAASAGALIAAACIGVSAGALIAHPGASTKGAPPPQSPGAPITFAPGPLAGAPAPLAAQPPAPQPPAEAAAAPVPPAAPPLATVPQTASADAQTQAPRSERPRRVAAARSAHGHRLVQAHAGCGHHVRCGAGSVKLADARLRRSYASAARAGVARPVLADYREEWTRLRHRAPHQPGVVAARYRHMAGDLDQLAARERTARAAPSSAGPWRRFRMQLAALWR